jgi:hypothetical protein
MWIYKIPTESGNLLCEKNGMILARPTKLTPYITQIIGENVSLRLPYVLAAQSVGITYQAFNEWMKNGKKSTSGDLMY